MFYQHLLVAAIVAYEQKPLHPCTIFVDIKYLISTNPLERPLSPHLRGPNTTANHIPLMEMLAEILGLPTTSSRTLKKSPCSNASLPIQPQLHIVTQCKLTQCKLEGIASRCRHL